MHKNISADSSSSFAFCTSQFRSSVDATDLILICLPLFTGFSFRSHQTFSTIFPRVSFAKKCFGILFFYAFSCFSSRHFSQPFSSRYRLATFTYCKQHLENKIVITGEEMKRDNFELKKPFFPLTFKPEMKNLKNSTRMTIKIFQVHRQSSPVNVTGSTRVLKLAF